VKGAHQVEAAHGFAGQRGKAALRELLQLRPHRVLGPAHRSGPGAAGDDAAFEDALAGGELAFVLIIARSEIEFGDAVIAGPARDPACELYAWRIGIVGAVVRDDPEVEHAGAA